MRRFFPFLFFILIATGLKAQDVYRTPNGKKYHTADCHMVKNVSEKIAVEKAVAAGLLPCLICKPVLEPQPALPKEAQGEKKKTEQCRSMTKGGTRCRHMTSIGNGYCFQHQPKGR